MSTMQVIEVTEFGGIEQLQLSSRALPQWQAGQLLLEVYASGVNRMDIVQRQGYYPPPPGASDIIGVEVAGVILAGDEDALHQAGFKVGDKVCAILEGGGYAQYVAVAVTNCLPVPKGLSMLQAASLPETFFTVWSNLFDYADLQVGQSLLLHGGSSGIGVAAIQIAKAKGIKVIVTAGSEEKCTACLQLGADYAINYKQQDFVEEVKQITQKQGVNVILDMVAGSYIEREIQCLATDGKIIVIAIQGGRLANFDVARLLVKRLTIVGTTLRSRATSYKAKIGKDLQQQVWPLLEQGLIKPIIHAVYPIHYKQDGLTNGAMKAHQEMQQAQHIGKIVLQWKQEDDKD